jgi:hypothetical protein
MRPKQAARLAKSALRAVRGGFCAVFLVLAVSGCASVRSYDQELQATMASAASGNVDNAIKTLEAANSGTKDLLYYLELGMLQRFGQRYDESQKAWRAAVERVKPGELPEDDALDVLRNASSYLVNDSLRPYAGYDYEKAMLLTYMALNYLAMGDFDQARVANKQTHEFEAQIAEARSKEVARVEEDARKRGAQTSFKELNGYPIETIDSPEVNALRNSYQSALSHYLAGFVYEALGEGSLAAPGYRLANELQPNQPLLEEGLRGLDQRMGQRDDGQTEVLFIVGSGMAPALQSRQFRLPVWIGTRTVFVVSSFPVMTESYVGRPPAGIAFDGGSYSLPLTPITSIDLMARRRLLDDMPGIMLRGTIRTATRAALQAGLQQAPRGGGGRDGGAAALGAAVALAIAATSVVVEKADERTWRTLPAEISIARARLPAGPHTVTLLGAEGLISTEVNISGRYAVVDLRLLRNRLFVNAPVANAASTRALR